MASAAIVSTTPVSSSSRKTFPVSTTPTTTPSGIPSSLKRQREYNHTYNNNNNDSNHSTNGCNTKSNDDDGDDDDNGDLPWTRQSKRQKVAFDSAVEVRVLERWGEKSYAHVREEVKQVFRRRNGGGGGGFGFGAITDLFAAGEKKNNDEGDDGDAAAPSSSLLRKYLLALTGHTGSLGRECSGLVYAILDHRWWERDAGFVNAYIRFLGSLVSAQSGYTSSVLKMLVGRFLEGKFGMCCVFLVEGANISQASSYSSSPSFKPLQKLGTDGERQISDDVHHAICYILELSPVASRSLAFTISSLYPFETERTRVHVRYVRNLLRLISYAPELKGDVLACVCERLVKIDVQIQVAMDDLDEDKEDELLHQIATDDTEIDKMEEEASDDESVISDDSDSSEDGHIQLLKENLTILDSLMAVLFNYYTTAFSDTNQTYVEDTFEQMLSSFTNTILPTYRSRHIQFLIFHFAQGSANFMERFIGALAQVAFDKTRPGFVQQAGAAYLASFVSRGMHLSADLIQDVIAFLGNQLDRLRELHEPSMRGPDLRKYGSYYATAQAILYIFCFRWQDLIIHPDDVSVDEDEALYGETDFDWASNVKGVLNRNIYSKLNPLKVCSPAIVTQFAHVARQLRFMYVFPLLESNKRIRLSHIFGTSSSEYRTRNESGVSFERKVSDSMYQLDAYFPFDPYQLPKSKRWIGGDYKEWKSLVEDETYQEENYKNDASVSSDLVEEDDGADDEEMVNGIVGSHSDSE